MRFKIVVKAALGFLSFHNYRVGQRFEISQNQEVHLEDMKC